ncbi:hypothetical protein QF001_000167 [Paraburkholderia youngii]
MAMVAACVPGTVTALLAQRLNDSGCQSLAHAWRELGQAVGKRLLAGCCKRGWRRVALE